MSHIAHDNNKQNIYKKYLDMVSKKIKDITTAEKDAKKLTEDELKENQ